MTTKGSFYQGSTIYTETSPAGPVSAPVPTTPGEARSSFYMGGGGVNYPTTSTSSPNLDLVISIPGAPLLPDEWLFGYKFDVAAYFPTDMVGSQAQARLAATGTPALSFRKNGAQFAIVTFTGTTGVFSGTQTNFAVGDLLEVYAPTINDATLAHISMTLFAPRF